MIGLVAGTIVSVAGALAVFDIEPPRPVFKSQLVQVQMQVLELDSIITSQQLNDQRLRLYQNERESQQWLTEEGFVPDWLLEERVLLESEIDALRNRLDVIRQQAVDN